MNDERRPIIGIPVKPFGVAKQRLHSRLDPATRSVLGRWIAARTAATVIGAGGEVVIVTGDSGVRRWAATLGIGLNVGTIRERQGAGLDGAATALRDHALDLGRPWLLVHADLPLISVKDIEAVLRPIHDGIAVIAPSHDGGTSVLGGHGRVEFRYGVGSYHRHLRQMPAATVIVRPGLTFDLDTVDDLDLILRHPRGIWIEELLTAIDSPT